MPLENLTGSNVFITNLVPSNPAGTDPVSEGDNHIAGTKNVLLNSFPAINGAVTATPTQLNQLAPVGGAEFTGIPTAPTAAPGTDTTQIATTEFVSAAVEAVADAALGVGQTWQDMTSSRASGVTYTNNTEKPISIAVTLNSTIANHGLTIFVDGVLVRQSFTADSASASVLSASCIIPTGSGYSVSVSNASISRWAELR